jgi:methionine sulfoxide reductase heme-binding subunit
MVSSLALWRDRQGRLSALRIGTLALLVWPALLAAYAAATGGLGARPWNDLIHRTGWWALVFLLLSLAVTPLRRSARFGKLIDVRRMIGVAAFVYAAAHLFLYVVDEKFDVAKVALEILSRVYLTIGFTALVGLALLAATSTDAMVRRLGGASWRRLHQLTYLIGILALIHYFQQTKADVSVPTLYAGLFVWLLGYRLLARWRQPGPVTLAGLAVNASALTFLGEALGIAWSFGVPPTTVLATAFDFDLGVRPGWWVLAVGLLVAVLDAVRARTAQRPTPGGLPNARPRLEGAA